MANLKGKQSGIRISDLGPTPNLNTTNWGCLKVKFWPRQTNDLGGETQK